MKRKVYINNCVFLREGFEEIDIVDKNIDLISRMCIISISKLMHGIENMAMNVPIFFGSAYSCLNSLHEFNKVCEKLGALRVNPSLFPNTVLNSPSCRAGIHFNMTQPIYNISNGASSGLDALGLAYMHIANGEVDNAIVSLAEEHSEIAEKIENKAFAHSSAAFYLSTQESDIEILKYDIDDASIGIVDNKQEQIHGSHGPLYQIENLTKDEGSHGRITIEAIHGSRRTIIQIKKEG